MCLFSGGFLLDIILDWRNSKNRVSELERYLDFTASSGLAVSSPTSDSLTVSWDEQPGVLFELRYKKVGEANSTRVSVRDITKTSYVLTGLDPSSLYNFRLRAWADTVRYVPHKSGITVPVSATTTAAPASSQQ